MGPPMNPPIPQEGDEQLDCGPQGLPCAAEGWPTEGEERTAEEAPPTEATHEETAAADGQGATGGQYPAPAQQAPQAEDAEKEEQTTPAAAEVAEEAPPTEPTGGEATAIGGQAPGQAEGLQTDAKAEQEVGETCGEALAPEQQAQATLEAVIDLPNNPPEPAAPAPVLNDERPDLSPEAPPARGGGCERPQALGKREAEHVGLAGELLVDEYKFFCKLCKLNLSKTTCFKHMQLTHSVDATGWLCRRDGKKIEYFLYRNHKPVPPSKLVLTSALRAEGQTSLGRPEQKPPRSQAGKKKTRTQTTLVKSKQKPPPSQAGTRKLEIVVKRKYFDAFLNGAKTFEGRLGAKKWTALSIGQEVVLKCGQTGRTKNATVSEAPTTHKTFAAMLEGRWHRFIPEAASLDAAVAAYHKLNWYRTKERERGAVCIPLTVKGRARRTGEKRALGASGSSQLRAKGTGAEAKRKKGRTQATSKTESKEGEEELAGDATSAVASSEGPACPRPSALPHDARRFHEALAESLLQGAKSAESHGGITLPHLQQALDAWIAQGVTDPHSLCEGYEDQAIVKQCVEASAGRAGDDQSGQTCLGCPEASSAAKCPVTPPPVPSHAQATELQTPVKVDQKKVGFPMTVRKECYDAFVSGSIDGTKTLDGRLGATEWWALSRGQEVTVLTCIETGRTVNARVTEAPTEHKTLAEIRRPTTENAVCVYLEVLLGPEAATKAPKRPRTEATEAMKGDEHGPSEDGASAAAEAPTDFRQVMKERKKIGKELQVWIIEQNLLEPNGKTEAMPGAFFKQLKKDAIRLGKLPNPVTPEGLRQVARDYFKAVNLGAPTLALTTSAATQQE